VGRALNVASVLEGSVRKSGNRVRIAVQLVKVADGYPLWSETYDRTLDDIFAVQDDIAQSVVKELREALLGEAPDSKEPARVKAEVAAAAKGRAASSEAHRLYLQGRHLLDRLNPEDTATGIVHLKQALELDPGHALAWVHLANAYINQGGYGWTPIDEGYGKAREAAARAVELAPDLAEAHAALGRIQAMYDWDWRGAEASYRRALELAPGNAEVLLGASVAAQCRGHVDEAVQLGRRAVEQDPLGSTGYSRLGFSYRAAGLFADAETALRKALELSPQRIITHLLLAMALLDQGRKEEALIEAEAEPAEWARLLALVVVHDAAGRKAEGDAALRDLETNHSIDAPYQIAAAHATRGDADAAFAWLERAIQERDSGIAFSRSERLFRGLHQDPRWEAFQRKVGFEE